VTSDEFSIFCANASPALAGAVARAVGVPLGAATTKRFPDGEVSIEIGESVRDKNVFIVQSTAPPVNDHLMELLAFADACRRASAARIVAIIPYFGYARSDKRHGRREPISARLVADLLQTSGVDHVITIDLHASQIEGFFHIPLDSLSAVCILCDAVRPILPPGTVVVSPDVGRLKMATLYAQRLNTSVVLLHKTRETGTETRVTHLVGDVRGRPCLVVDDMISTGGTILEAVERLVQEGARPGIFVAATHGLLLTGAREKLAPESVADIFVTDTIERPTERWPRVHTVSVAPLIAETIQRVTSGQLIGGPV
jgi:ribose-phosphate pyrophosphokinase